MTVRKVLKYGTPSLREKSKEVQNAILDRDCGGWTIRELFGDIFKTEWTQEFYETSAVTREGIPFTDGEGNYRGCGRD